MIKHMGYIVAIFVLGVLVFEKSYFLDKAVKRNNEWAKLCDTMEVTLDSSVSELNKTNKMWKEAVEELEKCKDHQASVHTIGNANVVNIGQ